MRVVIDTNIFVSGLLGSGTCRKLFLSFAEQRFDIVISEILFEELRFVKDNNILECAIEAKADCIVSRDKDLLILKSFHSIPILLPHQFLARLKK